MVPIVALLVALSACGGWRPPEGSVLRVDRAGRVVWRSPSRRIAFDSEPVLRDGQVQVDAYTRCGQQEVVHYDARSGKPAAGTVADLSAPVADGGLEFRPQLGAGPIAPTVGPPSVPGGFGVLALDAASGAPRWLTSGFSQGQPRLAAGGGVVAVVALNDPTRLTLDVLAADDGRELWKLEDPSYPFQVPVPRFGRPVPILAGGNVYVLDGQGQMEARDARSGTTRWKAPASGPVAAGDTMVVVHRGGNLVAYDHGGRRLWSKPLVKGKSAVFPAVAGGGVYVAASHGQPCPPSD
ncbi:MAG TPA: PQQ-binding-like beta-propeller repeat protein [Acidimicrobiales bacterium]|nr:PQQ-binding-like beta-propeller repeat protein [Acidimicrobiales bacterium]